MNYKSIIPDEFVPSKQCVKALLAKSSELSEQSQAAFKIGAYRLSSTLLHIASIYSHAACEAWDAQVAAADRRHTKAQKEMELVHSMFKSEEVPF